jgi:hypothetical protein
MRFLLAIRSQQRMKTSCFFRTFLAAWHLVLADDPLASLGDRRIRRALASLRQDRLFVGRQAEVERRALAWITLRPDSTTMPGNDFLNRCQSDARSRIFVLAM